MHSVGIAYLPNMDYTYNMKSKEAYKVISISLSAGSYKRLKEMASYFDISTSELIRRSLDVQHEGFLKQKFGYKGADIAKAKLSKDAAKEEREDRIAWIRSAAGEEVMAFLIECGYVENPEFEQGSKIVRAIVEPNEGGIMALRQRFFDKDSGELVYTSDLQPLEEVIRGLVKEKKI